MVKPLCIALALSITSAAMASESSVLAFRAQKSIEAGKFAKGYGQLERALLASRKESDLRSEGRILTSMAQVRVMSLDLPLADSLLAQVRKDALDDGSLVMYTKVKVSSANASEKFSDAEKFCNQLSGDKLKKIDESLKAAFYSECAIAHAGSHHGSDAQESLKLVGKNSDKKGGFYAYTAARISDLLGQSDADSLYQVAEEKSIQGNRTYMTANILWLRSQLKGAKNSSDMKLRCKNAFELMGLPNNSKRCGQ